MAMFNLPASFMQRPNQGLFSRSWAQPRQRAPFGALPDQFRSFLSNPMFRAADARQQAPLTSYLPLLMSRGLFNSGNQMMAPPMQQPSFTPAQPVQAPTTPSAIQQAAQQMAATNPAPQMFTPTPPVQNQPQQASAAPAWQPASWFSDPNSAARRIAAQMWGGLPLQQQQQFYQDTYMGGGVGGDAGNAGNDFGLGFGIDTAAGIY